MHVAQATPILEGGGAPIAPRHDAEAAAGPEAPDHGLTRDGVLYDYRIAYQSRQASLLGRREVLTGKAKFGIFGDGKEVAQVAMARAFRRGDLRSGYYRDQTLMFALGMLTIEQFFAQLYADPDVVREPCSAGRSMTAHFATCFVDHEAALPSTSRRASTRAPTCRRPARRCRAWSASPTPRGSTARSPSLDAGPRRRFSTNGDEIAFGTIGNASCAEGVFWEAVNAIGVLQAPMILSIWDDGYGISVPNEHQITKGDLSALLSGFRRDAGRAAGATTSTPSRAGTTRRSRETYLGGRRDRPRRARAGDLSTSSR